jgi:AcrR family transcriptional regulator
MARPLSEDRRNAILSAATELVAREGLSAATAQIAKDAGVPHGSVFTYFNTKVELMNAVYLELKKELINTVVAGLSGARGNREQLCEIWRTWTRWGVANPSKRRALAQLGASDQIIGPTRKAGYEGAAPVLEVIWRVSAQGALANAPRDYVGALVEAMAATTMDFMGASPEMADAICESGFEALWRALG